MIRALVTKDITLFFRNQFFAIVSVLGLVAYAAVYFLMPKTVDDTLTIGIYPPEIPAVFLEETADSGIVFVPKDSEEALRAGMSAQDNEYNVAFLFPEGWVRTLALSHALDQDVTILFTSDFPDELKEAYVVILEELSYTLSGQTINISATEEVVGQDLAGDPLAARERMVPLLAMIVLMVETMGLASLIASEVEEHTLQAVLTTPVRIGHLFLSKGITGVTLAFVQSALLVAVIGGLRQAPLLILAALLLGSILVTAVAFLIGSSSKDLLSVMAWAVPVLIVLAIPTFGIVFPGATTVWTRIIPTYYLVDTLHKVVNFGAGWADVWQNLLILLGFSAGFTALGILALRRKYR